MSEPEPRAADTFQRRARTLRVKLGRRAKHDAPTTLCYVSRRAALSRSFWAARPGRCVSRPPDATPSHPGQRSLVSRFAQAYSTVLRNVQFKVGLACNFACTRFAIAGHAGPRRPARVRRGGARASERGGQSRLQPALARLDRLAVARETSTKLCGAQPLAPSSRREKQHPRSFAALGRRRPAKRARGSRISEDR
jgi:hypothetical protein